MPRTFPDLSGVTAGVALVAALWISQIAGAASIIALAAVGQHRPGRLAAILDIIARTGE